MKKVLSVCLVSLGISVSSMSWATLKATSDTKTPSDTKNPSNESTATALLTNAQNKLLEHRKLAELGNAYSRFYLGLAYENGWGVEKDHTKAMEWYQAAAAQRQPDALFNIGMMYMNGRGVVQNETEAHRWLELSAAANMEEVKASMGMKITE